MALDVANAETKAFREFLHRFVNPFGAVDCPASTEAAKTAADLLVQQGRTGPNIVGDVAQGPGPPAGVARKGCQKTRDG